MIYGRKIILKPLFEENISKVIEVLKGESSKYLSEKFGANMDEDKLYNYFYNNLTSVKSNNIYFLVLTKSYKTLGYASIENINWVNGNAEYSILISENRLGLGYGSLVGQMIINFCFQELNLIKVYSKICLDNNRLISQLRNKEEYQTINNVVINDKKYSYYYNEVIRPKIL
ncbi:GNAT family N-acetyltransferase [Senegalia massiliensis]|nr:GNAT family N-acetyltransferase [Senegalia massiliensis]